MKKSNYLSEEQWAEVDRRSAEIKSGKAKMISHLELMKKLKAKLGLLRP
ncbi:MAG: hypothetical protein M3R17_15075 [Bacteroidota bacterium]|nr:hypothetical protein [Bacteroidota bacterium]